jgi:hypothetical protein
MEGRIFARAARGSERLYKVFWLLWVPFVILTILARRFAAELAPNGIGRSSAWPEYIAFIAFGIAAAWLLVAIWKCAPNVKFRIWFWLSRVYVVIQFLGLLQAMLMLARIS